MIHAPRPTVSPVANIVFAWNLICFETWVRTDGRMTWAKTMITTARDCELASWINKMESVFSAQFNFERTIKGDFEKTQKPEKIEKISFWVEI